MRNGWVSLHRAKGKTVSVGNFGVLRFSKKELKVLIISALRMGKINEKWRYFIMLISPYLINIKMFDLTHFRPLKAAVRKKSIFWTPKFPSEISWPLELMVFDQMTLNGLKWPEHCRNRKLYGNSPDVGGDIFLTSLLLQSFGH